MKETRYTIAVATEQDIPHIISLVKKLAEYEKLSHEVTASEEDYRRYGFGPNPVYRSFIVKNMAEEGPRYLGFALYFFTFSTFLGKPTLYLEDLFVLPEFRGRGIGTALLRKLAGVAVAHDCGRMEWSVLDWNEPAIRFYRKIGAQAMSEWTVFRLTGKHLLNLAEPPDERG